jgi:hypothetical protein
MKKQLIGDFAWGISILLLALGATSARNLGYIDADTVNRLVFGASGLMVAWFGNRIPKTIAPSARADQVFIDGALTFDRTNPAYQPLSDFELGQPGFGLPAANVVQGAR